MSKFGTFFELVVTFELLRYVIVTKLRSGKLEGPDV